MSKTKKSYTAAPQVPAEQSERLAMILEVLAGSRSVSDAARTLGMSRNHFQTLLHRGLAGMVESMQPKSAGRPAKPKEVVELQAKLERLKRENEKLQQRVGTTDRLLQAASGLLQGRSGPTRQSRTRRQARGADKDSGEEPHRQELQWIGAMRRRAPARLRRARRVEGAH
jgi:transposase-like protein